MFCKEQKLLGEPGLRNSIYIYNLGLTPTFLLKLTSTVESHVFKIDANNFGKEMQRRTPYEQAQLLVYLALFFDQIQMAISQQGALIGERTGDSIILYMETGRLSAVTQILYRIHEEFPIPIKCGVFIVEKPALTIAQGRVIHSSLPISQSQWAQLEEPSKFVIAKELQKEKGLITLFMVSHFTPKS